MLSSGQIQEIDLWRFIMTQHWALIIGINNYQHLQPLLYAQRDAQTLRNFLVEEGEFSAERTILLSDFSPAIGDRSTHPDRANIQDWLSSLEPAAFQPNDLVWLYLCGYGVHWDGKDYFMPIDGNPAQMPDSAIALQDIYEQLHRLPTQNRLVMLDISRSQAQLDNTPVGQQILNIASELGIATILSGQPGQFSHETIMLRSGLFTHALLEGLRQFQPVTLNQLVNHLQQRLPELSQHHWRPIQHPAVVVPSPIQQMTLLPRDAAVPVGAAEVSKGGVGAIADPTSTAPETVIGSTNSQGITQMPPEAANSQATSSKATSALVTVPKSSPKSSSDSFWQRFLLYSGLGLLALLILGVARNPFLLPWIQPQPDGTASVIEPINPPPAESPADPADGNTTDAPSEEAAVAELNGESAADSTTASTADPTAETADQPVDPAAEAPAVPSPSVEEPAAGGLFSPLANLFRPRSNNVRPRTAIANAEAAIEAGLYETAIEWLDTVPENRRDEAYQELRQTANNRLQDAIKANRELLESAKAPIRPNQASTFNQAIAAARRIQPNQPLYEEAQANIDRWSQVILDLAEGRAAEGNIDAAISAAELVPTDRPKLYEQAQASIRQWQQRKDNQALIAEANALIQPGQAHTYEKAIEWLQPIQSDQPGYGTAQQLINQWSREMLAIARARAAQGRFDSAVAAAQLVPENTVAYEQAQAEIQRWQEKS